MKKHLVILMLLLISVNGSENMASPVALQKHPATLLIKRDDGTVMDVSGMKGKVVFLNFWATSCIPCKAEMPTINQLQLHYQRDTNIMILPIDLDNDLPGSIGFMNAHKLNLRVYTIAGAIPRSLFNGVLPTTVVIGRDGGIAMFKEGESDYGTREFYRFTDSLMRQ